MCHGAGIGRLGTVCVLKFRCLPSILSALPRSPTFVCASIYSILYCPSLFNSVTCWDCNNASLIHSVLERIVWDMFNKLDSTVRFVTSVVPDLT